MEVLVVVGEQQHSKQASKQRDIFVALLFRSFSTLVFFFPARQSWLELKEKKKSQLAFWGFLRCA